MNKVPIDQLVEGVVEGTLLSTPAKLNKRISLLDNGFLQVNGDYMPEDAKDGINLAVIRGINKTPDRTLVKGREDLTAYRVGKDGTLEPYKVETHVDGVIYLRDDIFEGLALSGGMPAKTGAQKGTLTYTADGEGMLLGKFAYHRAGEAISKRDESKRIFTQL